MLAQPHGPSQAPGSPAALLVGLPGLGEAVRIARETTPQENMPALGFSMGCFRYAGDTISLSVAAEPGKVLSQEKSRPAVFGTGPVAEATSAGYWAALCESSQPHE